MANMIVTFASMRPRGQAGTSRAVLASFRLQRGDEVRTELIPIGNEARRSDLAALPNEDVVTLQAGADCWVELGPIADAIPPVEEPSGAIIGWCRFMARDTRETFLVAEGDQVSVVAA